MRRLALRVPTGLAWLWAALALTASGADAPAVFARASSEGVAGRPAESRELDRGQETEASHLRTAELDLAGLRALRQAAALGRPARAWLNLFEDAEFDWVVERTASTERGYSLSGPLAGVEGGTATLVVNGGMAVGSAWTPDGAYRIRTVGRTQIVERVEPSLAPACVGTVPARSAERPERGAQTDSAPEDDGSEIDVLVPYTPEARRRAGGHRAILAEIDHRVAWTNEAYAASDVVHRVRLVGAVEVEYDERGRSADYNALHNEDDGHMDDVHALRYSLAADVVVLRTTSGGVASRLTYPGHWHNSQFTFATFGGRVTTFAHELGHLLGIAHEREDGSTNLPFPYSHGYAGRVPNERGFSTIMVSWGGDLPRFSNPRQRHRGVPLGVPGEEPTGSADGPADAARSMNETRREVANFRRSATRCRYRLSAPPEEVPAAGGAYTLRVEADAGCPWTVRSADGFTTVESGASGTGGGTVAYRVPANEGWLRETALAVAGRMHVAMQPGTRPLKPVCERSAWTRDLLEAELGMDCADITAAELSSVTSLDLSSRVQPAPGDFDGLSNLGSLHFALPEGGILPVGVFDGLASVGNLEVWGHDLSLERGSFRGLRNATRVELHLGGDVPVPQGAFDGMPLARALYLFGDGPVAPGAFEGLTGLRDLTLLGEFVHLQAGTLRGLGNLQWLDVWGGAHDGSFATTVAPGLFAGLPNLERLELKGLAEVPEGLFAGLSALRQLRLQNNAFTSLPPGVFEDLSSLRSLIIHNYGGRYRQELATLPPGLFSGLSSLTTLALDDVGLRDLRSGAFREVGSTLRALYLDNNQLAALDAGAFDGLAELIQLFLGNNQLATLPSGVFDDLASLARIRLRDNALTTLPSGVFDNNANMQAVELENNNLTALPPDAFRNHPGLHTVRLHGNRLTTLPPGLFGFRFEAGTTTNIRRQNGIEELTLHGNPGAPFALGFDPVVASAPWQRPVRVAARVAEGAPITLEVALDAVRGRLEADSATVASGAFLSDALAVRPTGRSPTVVRIAGLPDAPGEAGCAAIVDGGRRCARPAHTGIVLEAGPPLVLNGVAEQREFDEPAEIDLANVFLEFDDSARPAFSVRSSDPAVATAELSGRLLKIAPATPGTATITITATAPNGATATRTFSVTVPAAEHRFMRGWRLTLLDDGEGTQETQERLTHPLRHKEQRSR